MAEITLSKYCDQAKELIRTDSYDQAIAICRHMLKHYPKYVRAYRLLGEACLEKGDYVEAANLFKRVLGSDMEDMVVYVGLGIIFDEQGALEEAIWQLERAFEISPGNAEIRKELQRLYAQRDGTTPPKLKLTPAALGRLYLREELYQRAIDEFKGVLEEDPQRVDLQVALAAALWWSNQKQEAAQVCEEILEEYPNCLKANLVLGEILLSSDREEEGKTLLETAQAMDPENLVSQSLFRDRSPLGPEAVTVPRLDSEQVEQELQELQAEEGASASRTEPSPAHPQAVPEEEMPDWLSRLQREERKSEGERVTSLPEEPDMPDWLQQLAEERASEGGEDAEASERGPAVLPEEPADWLSEMSDAVQETAPETLSPGEVLPSQDEVERIESEEEPAAEASQETPTPPEETPDWLSQLRSQFDSAEEAARPTEPSEDETPEWLRSLQEEPLEDEPTPASGEEVPAWLRDLRTEAAKAGVVPDEEEISGQEPIHTDEKPEEGPVLEAYDTETTTPEAGDEPEIGEETMERLRETMPDESDSIEDIMAWMEKSKALLSEEGLAEEIVHEDSAEPPRDAEVPTWLRELRPSTTAPAEALPGEELEGPSEEDAVPTPEEEIPTWLRDLRPETAGAGEPALEVESGPPPREEPVTHEEEPTVPLEKPEGGPEEEQIPSWLLQLRAEEAIEEEESLSVQEPEAPLEAPPVPPEEELPSWLRDLREEASTEQESTLAQEPEPAVEETPAPPREEIPSWLRDLREEASTEQEPTLTEEPEPAVEETPAPPREEMPSWLRQLQEEAMAEEEAFPSSEQEIAPEELAAPSEDDMPSWLRKLREEAIAADEFLLGEEPTAAPSTEEEAPSWLLELRAQTGADLGTPAPGEEEISPEELLAPSSEEEEMPSWLRGLRAEVDEEKAPPPRDEHGVPFDEPAPHVVEAELPTWLQELRAEVEQESPLAAPEEVEPGLAAEPVTSEKPEEPPSRLREPQGVVEDITEEELKAPEEEVPGRSEELEDVPSWLRELRAQAKEGETDVLAEKAEAAADEVPLPPLDEEELPSWLRELRAEAAVEDSRVPRPSDEAPPSEEIAAQEPLEPSREEEETLAEAYDEPALAEEESVLTEAPVEEAEAPSEAQDLALALEGEPIPAEEAAREEEALAVPSDEELYRPEGAPERFIEILETDPRDHSSRLALARAYWRAGDLDRAVEQYQHMLSLGAMVGEVKADLESAVESAPDHLPIHELLADVYMRAGDLQRALEKYRWLRAAMDR